MKIIVTGALGHIGSKLVREIPTLFPEAEILMIDNLSTQRYCSLFNLPKNGKYRFIEADILNVDLYPIVERADFIIHLAAITNATESFESKEHIENHNYNVTKKIAMAAARTNAAMIFISSTSVYGSQSERVDENCTLSDLQPQSPYAETKLNEEELLTLLAKTKGLKHIIFRFGTIFGVSEGMRFHTAINKFCWQAVLGVPITVWRTALNQRRPYLALYDAIEAIKFVIEKNCFDNTIYNVLTMNSTVDDIVKIIKKSIPNLTIQYVDTEIMNQLSYNVCNQRFKNLGFEFKGDLEKGISETISVINLANNRN